MTDHLDEFELRAQLTIAVDEVLGAGGRLAAAVRDRGGLAVPALTVLADEFVESYCEVLRLRRALKVEVAG